MNTEYYKVIRTSTIGIFNDSGEFKSIDLFKSHSQVFVHKTQQQAKNDIAKQLELISGRMAGVAKSVKFEEGEDGNIYWLFRAIGRDGTLKNVGEEYEFKIIKKEYI